ncbi:MAG: sugar transferase [Patescibacteria group bacterium]
MAMKLKVAGFRKLALVLGDATVFVAGLLFTLGLRYGFSEVSEQWQIHRAPYAIIFIFWLLSFYSVGLYTLQKAKNNRAFFTLLFGGLSINAFLSVLFFYFIPYFAISPKTVLFFDLATTAVLLLAWRSFFNQVVSLPPLKLIVIGSGAEVDEVIADLKKHPQQGYECVLHLVHESEARDLPKLIAKHHIDGIVVATDYRHSVALQKALFECIPLRIQFFDFVDFYELILQKIPLETINRAWFLENLNEESKQLFTTLKRALDIVLAFFLSIIGLLLSPFIILAIWLGLGRPIIFVQRRVGYFEKPFHIYKFRTFRHEGEPESVTRLAQFLRSTHLDEIPQLWNILKGEMSFVGPRPEQVAIVEELKEKIPFYVERFLVHPGITGWAQLANPTATAEDAPVKLQYDLFYIKHRSLLLDAEIILKTLKLLVLSK